MLCNILGVSRNEDIEATAKRKRVERGRETIISVRIIGALLKPRVVSGDEGMVLAVSNSLASCFDLDHSLNVLQRQSCVWDPVEGDLTEKLVAREMKFAELETAGVGLDCSSSDEELSSGTELDFKISWDRTSKHTERAFEPYDEKRVLGNVCHNSLCSFRMQYSMLRISQRSKILSYCACRAEISSVQS